MTSEHDRLPTMAPRKKRSGAAFECGWCGEYFVDSAAYGRHCEAPTNDCLTIDEMVARGMVRSPAGFWAIPARPSPVKVTYRRRHRVAELAETLFDDLPPDEQRRG
jgi:hypothetical protein